jgi:hypothetical protein
MNQMNSTACFDCQTRQAGHFGHVTYLHGRSARRLPNCPEGPQRGPTRKKALAKRLAWPGPEYFLSLTI